MNRIRKLLDFIIRFLSFLRRRDKQLIVYCGARDLFVDNCKYQYLYNVQNMASYRHVWLTKNENVVHRLRQLDLEVARSDSAEGKYFLKRAGFCVFDDGLGIVDPTGLLTGSVRINLWHGIPAKYITYEKTEPEDVYNKKRSFLERIRHGHIRGYIGFSPSKKMNVFFSHFFALPEKQILIGAYPRTYPFFLRDSLLDQFLLKYENTCICELFDELKNCGKRKYIYMPTFRDGDENYMDEAIPDWNELDCACQKANVLFYVKVHRAAKMPDVSKLSCIRAVDKNLDVYPILSQFDLLITDYSSIMFDFALTGNKIVLYAFDIEEYTSKSRNIYSYFWNLMERLTCVKSFKEMIAALVTGFGDVKDFPKESFFDCPQKFDTVKNFIQGRSE